MKVRHILGISGGKDSAALAIYLKQKYPALRIEYYNSDTGCELAETELLIDRLIWEVTKGLGLQRTVPRLHLLSIF